MRAPTVDSDDLRAATGGGTKTDKYGRGGGGQPVVEHEQPETYSNLALAESPV